MLRKINIPSLAHPLAWQPGLGGEFLRLEFKIRLGHKVGPFLHKQRAEGQRVEERLPRLQEPWV